MNVPCIIIYYRLRRSILKILSCLLKLKHATHKALFLHRYGYFSLLPPHLSLVNSTYCSFMLLHYPVLTKMRLEELPMRLSVHFKQTAADFLQLL